MYQYLVPYDDELYDDYMRRIIEARGYVADSENYQEKHHIVPRCMGGSDDKSNIIPLYAEEHFYAHKLLAQENPDNEGLVCAYWMFSTHTMDGKQSRYVLTAEEYAEAKKLFGVMQSKRSKGIKRPEDFGAKVSAGKKGYKQSEETKRLLSQKAKERYANGEQVPTMLGKHHTEEAKKKLSEARKLMGRPVRCVETGEVFCNAARAVDWCGCKACTICNNLRGRFKSAGHHPETKEPLHWEYVE